jgi:hypothetical protein
MPTMGAAKLFDRFDRDIIVLPEILLNLFFAWNFF